MRKREIIKEWITDYNMKVFITIDNYGHFCGYVKSPKMLEGIDMYFLNSIIKVHGGITFQGVYPDKPGYWYGFDTNHSGDKANIELAKQYFDKVDNDTTPYDDKDITIRYVIDNCEELSEQLYNLNLIVNQVYTRN